VTGPSRDLEHQAQVREAIWIVLRKNLGENLVGRDTILMSWPVISSRSQYRDEQIRQETINWRSRTLTCWHQQNT
jgi:hypothetical protein